MINCVMCGEYKLSFHGKRPFCNACSGIIRREKYRSGSNKENYLRVKKNFRFCKRCRNTKPSIDYTGSNTICIGCKLLSIDKDKKCLNCKEVKKYSEFEIRRRVCIDCGSKDLNNSIVNFYDIDSFFEEGYRERINLFMVEVLKDLSRFKKK